MPSVTSPVAISACEISATACGVLCVRPIEHHQHKRLALTQLVSRPACKPRGDLPMGRVEDRRQYAHRSCRAYLDIQDHKRLIGCDAPGSLTSIVR